MAETFRTGAEWLVLAQQILEFTRPGEARVGMLPSSIQAGRAMALDMLRQIDIPEARWVLSNNTMDEAESDAELIRAAVRGHGEAIATIERSDDEKLVTAYRRAVEAFHADSE